jgi:hypothetical protein
VSPRVLLAAGFWTFIISFSIWPNSPVSATSIGVLAPMVLMGAAWLIVLRRVGWWAVVVPYIRPIPFLGYWLWVFFAPPRRSEGVADWVAWFTVLSPFLFTLLPN